MRLEKITYPTFPRAFYGKTSIKVSQKVVPTGIKPITDKFEKKGNKPEISKIALVPRGLSTFATLNYPI